MALGHVEHEKKTFFSSLQNSRSEDGGQGRALFARREAGLPLDGHRNGGYARQRAGRSVPASILCFQHVDAAATSRYRAVTAHRPFFF